MTAEERAEQKIRATIDSMNLTKEQLEDGTLTIKQAIKAMMADAEDAAASYVLADVHIWQEYEDKREELAEFIESRCQCTEGGYLRGTR